MSGEPKKILVAEDNPALAGVVRFNLQRAGYHVSVAQNGREGWELAQQDQYDVVVTDQQMPEMTGVELCERLRQHADYIRTPLILLTAKGLELDMERLRAELRVATALPKPFSPIELVNTIEDCLAKAGEEAPAG